MHSTIGHQRRDWERAAREQLEKDGATFIEFILDGPHKVVKRSDHVRFECSCRKNIETKRINSLLDLKGCGAKCKECKKIGLREKRDATCQKLGSQWCRVYITSTGFLESNVQI